MILCIPGAYVHVGGLPTKEYSDIYGLMTYHGVPKPGWRAFQLLHGAGDHRVPATLASDQARLAAARCVTEAGTDMAGFTLSAHADIKTAAACCAACQQADQDHCSFWSARLGWIPPHRGPHACS